MNRQPCELAQRLWSEAFDGGQSVPEAVASHLAVCGHCQEFQAGAALLRQQLTTTPMPLPSPDRDRQLLALLPSGSETPARSRRSRRSWWSQWIPALRSPVAPTLAAVGFAAFAVTLVTAHLLTVLPAERPLGPPPGAASARNPEKTPVSDSLERWLASPQPRLIPIDPGRREVPTPRSAPERGMGDPSGRQRSGRSYLKAPAALG